VAVQKFKQRAASRLKLPCFVAS